MHCYPGNSACTVMRGALLCGVNGYNKNTIKDLIKYILDNCFFTVGKSIYRQTIGIPMGSDPAPFFANFFLFHYESEWMKELRKKDLKKAYKYNNISRFIDDLLALNDGGEFHNSHPEIYPKDLTLNKENENDDHATWYDLDITVVDGKFVTKLYDKRDSYHFNIVRLPYKNSNIPLSTFYATIGAEMLRIARATSGFFDFITTTSIVLKRMLIQGATVEGIKRVTTNTIKHHWHIFSKYCFQSKEIIDKLLDEMKD